MSRRHPDRGARTCAVHNPGDLACDESCEHALRGHVEHESEQVGPASVEEMDEAVADAQTRPAILDAMSPDEHDALAKYFRTGERS